MELNRSRINEFELIETVPNVFFFVSIFLGRFKEIKKRIWENMRTIIMNLEFYI